MTSNNYVLCAREIELEKICCCRIDRNPTDQRRPGGPRLCGHILDYVTMLAPVVNEAELKERHIHTSKR